MGPAEFTAREQDSEEPAAASGCRRVLGGGRCLFGQEGKGKCSCVSALSVSCIHSRKQFYFRWRECADKVGSQAPGDRKSQEWVWKQLF